jgi:hypothetical protein
MARTMIPSSDEMMATAAVLASSRFERGWMVTKDEDRALAHWSMFGATGYPVRKLGRGWIVDHEIMTTGSIYKTKGEAVAAWEQRIYIVIRLKGLQQHAEATR